MLATAMGASDRLLLYWDSGDAAWANRRAGHGDHPAEEARHAASFW